jgi:hypothetical protein
VVGLILVTRQGRKFAARKLLRSPLASLWRVARSPVRLALLFGWYSWRLLRRTDCV